MKILIKGKVETVSLDRVKPAHLECEPTTGPTTQRTTPTKKQSSKTGASHLDTNNFDRVPFRHRNVFLSKNVGVISTQVWTFRHTF